MSNDVQVKDANGNLLGSTKPARARKLLRAGRATIATKDPFTIRLRDSPNDETPELKKNSEKPAYG